MRATLANARARLLESCSAGGAWSGHLSSSALSTATATIALQMAADAASANGRDRPDYARLAAAGRDWLYRHQKADGGWGDTDDSPSNISTTTLCWVCLGTADDAAANAGAWLERECGGLTPAGLAASIRAQYGRDHTFAVPILTTCALGGRLGEDGWRFVPALPFELAACPHQWFRWLRLRTVSYALPALIAIGQARHHHRPTRNPVLWLARHFTKRRTLGILSRIQPDSGGYLEAAPLTSFVVMSLVSMGLDRHEVVAKGLGFLADTVRADGSWPIDTNLDTWLTTLSVNALAGDTSPRSATLEWLLGQQYLEEHPYTHAAPGGWAWTDLSGGVPDADDTAGALLALRHLVQQPDRAKVLDAARRGVSWLLDLQNRDGGTPTFCRGWGKLPFDRSGADLAAHAVRAFAAWREELSGPLRHRVERATNAAIRYLLREQRGDGAFIPLWFGNQHDPRQENPIYGTSRVLRAVAAVRGSEELDPAWVEAGRRAVSWLLGAQGACGGFGPVPTVEETALAVEGLAEWVLLRGGEAFDDGERLRASITRGTEWLVERTEQGTRFDPAPIGLYFARLWYSERLYPVIFTVSALALAQRCLKAPVATGEERA